MNVVSLAVSAVVAIICVVWVMHEYRKAMDERVIKFDLQGHVIEISGYSAKDAAVIARAAWRVQNEQKEDQS